MNAHAHSFDTPDAQRRTARAPLPATEYDLIRWHGHAALLTVLISALFGILVATKFNFPNFMGGHAWETWGRLRYNHTQGIFFGWLGNAFIAFFYYVTPRLTERPVTSRRLGWVLFFVWNFMVVLPGWALVLIGFQPAAGVGRVPPRCRPDGRRGLPHHAGPVCQAVPLGASGQALRVWLVHHRRPCVHDAGLSCR